jgi:acyl carrier protein
MEELIRELKVKIVETLNFEDLTPEAIHEDAPLVGGDLGIDSIDVLELVMMLEKDYGILVDNKELGAQVFASLRTLAEYVDNHIRFRASSN